MATMPGTLVLSALLAFLGPPMAVPSASWRYGGWTTGAYIHAKYSFNGYRSMLELGNTHNTSSGGTGSCGGSWSAERPSTYHKQRASRDVSVLDAAPATASNGFCAPALLQRRDLSRHQGRREWRAVQHRLRHLRRQIVHRWVGLGLGLLLYWPSQAGLIAAWRSADNAVGAGGSEERREGKRQGRNQQVHERRARKRRREAEETARMFRGETVQGRRRR